MSTKAQLKLLTATALCLPVIWVIKLLQFTYRRVSNKKAATFIREKMCRPLENSKTMERVVDWGVRDLERRGRK